MSITVLTYLHGRLTQTQKSHYGYILSSSDFGCAYLAERWATKFVKSLIQHYSVVSVGYSAEDLSVHYLLQGLKI
jgi:hypothetical protein